MGFSCVQLTRDLIRQYLSLSEFFQIPFLPLLLAHFTCSSGSKGHGASYAFSSSHHCIHTHVVGQIPIQLAELSPPTFRAMFPGVTYQLGNVCLVSNDPWGNRACDRRLVYWGPTDDLCRFRPDRSEYVPTCVCS